MPMIVGGGEPNIAAGTYPGRLTGIRESDAGEFGGFRIWEFSLDDGRPCDGASSLGLGPKTKGYRWAANILGRPPVKGEDIEPLLIGKPCLLVVQLNMEGWPKVAEVMPPMAAGAPEPQPEQARVTAAVGVDDLPF